MDHYPVMAPEVIDYLAVKPEGVYLDATAGLGGHTREIARRLTTGFVIASDRDAESLEKARRSLLELGGRVRFTLGEFSTLREGLRESGVERVNGLVADLGVSRYQLMTPERGFSLSTDGPLDMRMNQSAGTTAADLVNQSAEKALADLIYQFGEERRARKLARAIVRARPIRSTLHLAGVVERAAPRTGRLHPATKVFMALRIAVNDELGQLDRLLALAPELTRAGGRIVVISFSSLEDRKAKEKFRELGRQGRATVLTKHPVRPSGAEVEANPPSRSAKLRAVEMRTDIRTD
ncbi:MAG: 16S rRNA (cytosine(1402)-N(4))-methyltransferase RsmH [Candidatus Solibacter usitatus]|nr:16S rRNA (cytosine(1402)-N(4))-methyltransferase RsmH [Candidatus Solibacter usitatus]